MACCLFGDKPLSKPMLGYSQFDYQEQTSVEFESEFYHFHLRKYIWRSRLSEWRPSLIVSTRPFVLQRHLVSFIASIFQSLAAYGMRDQYNLTAWGYKTLYVCNFKNAKLVAHCSGSFRKKISILARNQWPEQRHDFTTIKCWTKILLTIISRTFKVTHINIRICTEFRFYGFL